ncbi:inositol monophosphatase family protein [Actinoalloteichus hymeniacidonis]|uniref:inositol monophosphatase family protein n=1 Tax=Actinoalloteichus hymeniacidonis TaxID=340345 RepID=UPI00181D92B3|nr:inositol monophosphatase family protein [Actinoalloteichus hymeniacidonis]MBB5906232.1 myo-inositol-1(or 4)-monophosphatase [Actinoalloteichus hymeniacidonis]
MAADEHVSTLIDWPVPEPALPEAVHPALADAARAASTAYGLARHRHTRVELAAEVAMGADGTPTMLVDRLVEDAIAESAHRNGVNLLSEETGFVDNGSAMTLVVDPVDGSANAASGVPLSCFAGVLAVDGVPTEALTTWLDTGRAWHALAGQPTPFRTSGRTELDGAAVSLLRPKPNTVEVWQRVALRAGRVRVLSTTCLEAVLVAEGSIDAFADVGSRAHRIMDLAAAMVTVPAAGGVVLDAHGDPLELDHDLNRRWSGVVAASRELAEELIEEIGTTAG